MSKPHDLVLGTLEIRPPERLVFTWRWETHELLPNETARDEHEKGWAGCLDGLHRFVSTTS
jgi:uncharacterized protein YndB with AHSA1/START domain